MKTEKELRAEISKLLCDDFGPVCTHESSLVTKLIKIIDREVASAHESHEYDALGEDR